MRKTRWILALLGLALAIAASLWLASRPVPRAKNTPDERPDGVSDSDSSISLAGINSYSGSTTISGGTVNIGLTLNQSGAPAATFSDATSRPVTPGSVTGQPLTDTPQSLEWLVADSQVVAVGECTEVSPLIGSKWVARFAVSEMIRGPDTRELSFVVRAPWSARPAMAKECYWPSKGSMLVFLGPVAPSDDRLGASYELRHCGRPYLRQVEGMISEWARYRLDPETGPQLASMNCRVLRTPAEVLAAARAAAQAIENGRQREAITMPGVFTNQPPGIHFGRPTDPWGRPGPGRFDGKHPGDRQARLLDQGSLVVPLDERLEKVAKDWIAGDDSQKRELALYNLLRPFKSAENIAYLQSLLKDDRFIYYGDDELVYRFYHVRIYAAKLLNDWGIDTPRPVDEEMVYYRPMRWWPWIAGAIALLAVLTTLRIVWGVRSSRSPYSPRAVRFIGLRLTGGPTGLSCLLCLALGFLWLRSHYRIDDLRTSTSNYRTDNRRIFSFAGKLHYRQERDRTSSWPKFIYGSFPTHSEWDELWQGRLALYPGAQTHFNKLGITLCTHAPIHVKGTIPGWCTLTIPLWMPTLLTGLLPAWALLSACVRYTNRKRRGLCTTCAYDLRASPGRCPECGKERHA